MANPGTWSGSTGQNFAPNHAAAGIVRQLPHRSRLSLQAGSAACMLHNLVPSSGTSMLCWQRCSGRLSTLKQTCCLTFPCCAGLRLSAPLAGQLVSSAACADCVQWSSAHLVINICDAGKGQSWTSAASGSSTTRLMPRRCVSPQLQAACQTTQTGWC